jgi:hypothetical protein
MWCRGSDGQIICLAASLSALSYPFCLPGLSCSSLTPLLFIQCFLSLLALHLFLMSLAFMTIDANKRKMMMMMILTNPVSLSHPYMHTQVIISSPTGTETIELDERELYVVSTNEADRKAAIAKFAELQDSFRARSQSRSPRTTRREPSEREETLPPLPTSQGRPITAHGASSAVLAGRTREHDTASRTRMRETSAEANGSGSSGTQRSSSAIATGKSSNSSHRQKRPHTSAGSTPPHHHSSDSGAFGLFGKRSRLSAAASASVAVAPELSRPDGTGNVGPSGQHSSDSGAFSSSSLPLSSTSGRESDTKRMRSLARTESAKSDLSMHSVHHQHSHGRRQEQHRDQRQHPSAWWPMASPSSSTGTSATTATTTTTSSVSSMHDGMHTDTSASSLADGLDSHGSRASSTNNNSNNRGRSISHDNGNSKVRACEEGMVRIGLPMGNSTPSKSRKGVLAKFNKLLRRGNSPPT